jgi:hypothetical protein
MWLELRIILAFNCHIHKTAQEEPQCIMDCIIIQCTYSIKNLILLAKIREPFEKFVDQRQCAVVMQSEAVTVMPSCSSGGNVVVA